MSVIGPMECARMVVPKELWDSVMLIGSQGLERDVDLLLTDCTEESEDLLLWGLKRHGLVSTHEPPAQEGPLTPIVENQGLLKKGRIMRVFSTPHRNLLDAASDAADLSVYSTARTLHGMAFTGPKAMDVEMAQCSDRSRYIPYNERPIWVLQWSSPKRTLKRLHRLSKRLGMPVRPDHLKQLTDLAEAA